MLTRLREAKVELDVISRIAGHSSLEMTQRYICDDAREMKEAILKLNIHHNSVTNLINESQGPVRSISCDPRTYV